MRRSDLPGERFSTIEIARANARASPERTAEIRAEWFASKLIQCKARRDEKDMHSGNESVRLINNLSIRRSPTIPEKLPGGMMSVNRTAPSDYYETGTRGVVCLRATFEGSFLIPKLRKLNRQVVIGSAQRQAHQRRRLHILLSCAISAVGIRASQSRFPGDGGINRVRVCPSIRPGLTVWKNPIAGSGGVDNTVPVGE